MTTKRTLNDQTLGNPLLKAACVGPAILMVALFPSMSTAEFSLNFQSNPNIVNSMANVSCSGGGGGMGGGGMGGMMGFGPGCDSTVFTQELVNDNGTQYYHVFFTDPTQDFAMEFYMRTGGCCWFGGGGGMGGMGGGDAPFSSSAGDVNNRLANAFDPFLDAGTSGTGTANPSRVYMRQTNNDGQMTQVFDKPLEAMKPRITQTIDDGSTISTFDLDMRNSSYTDTTIDPSVFINTLALNEPQGMGDFDMATDAPQRSATAGRFSYTEGTEHGGSFGTYDYGPDRFDVISVDWLSYCDPAQNPDRQCNFTTGGGGGMMGGGGGMMGGGGGGMMGGMN